MTDQEAEAVLQRIIDQHVFDHGFYDEAYAALAALVAERDAAKKACNICGEPWPTHHPNCAYPCNVRDKEQAATERDSYFKTLAYITTEFDCECETPGTSNDCPSCVARAALAVSTP